MAAEPILETSDLTIRFGGHVAVNAVSCVFRRGTVVAIVGPNGAGKTTYFNLISGQLKASSGTVSLRGQNITALGPAARTRQGIGRAFQLTNLFPNLTVRENVRLAVQSVARLGFNFLTSIRKHGELEAKADDCLRRVNLDRRANSLASVLSHGDQRKLEVAILSALEPEVFMFDEPTAGMSVDEVPAVLNLIAEIKARGDKTILLVEHKMDVVRSLADRIIVLHNGTLVADGDPATVVALPIVQEAYLGIEPERNGAQKLTPNHHTQ
jgi:branched-chain amino acid transport system ATP-binding protein